MAKKMSNVKKSNTWTMEEVHKEIINWHNEVHTYWHQILMSNMKVTKIGQKYFLCAFWRIFVTIICDVKINICEPHYVWISFLWTFSIVHVFDFLTFDIFLTTFHHLTYCCPITYVLHYSWEQGWWGIWAMWHVPLLDLHRGRVMGHMFGQLGTWS